MAQLGERVERCTWLARGRTLAELFNQIPADRLDQRLFAGEVIEQGAVVDAGCPGDVSKAQAFETAFSDEVKSDADDIGASIGADGRGHAASIPDFVIQL